MAYEFHSDPPIQHSKAVEELLAEAIYLLREMDDAAAQEAEALLRQARSLAEALEVPKGTIMSRLFHARKKMQVALAPYLSGEVVSED